MGYPPETSTVLAVIPSLLVVNLIIAIYVYLAWTSEPFKDFSSSSCFDPDSKGHKDSINTEKKTIADHFYSDTSDNLVSFKKQN